MFHLVFASLNSHNFLKRLQWRCGCTALLCYLCHRTSLCLVYYDSGIEILFIFTDNVNLCKSNVMQIFQLIFCDSERKLLAYLLRKTTLILLSKSFNKSSIGYFLAGSKKFISSLLLKSVFCQCLGLLK